MTGGAAGPGLRGARLAWYRLTVTVARRWPGYVALALLTGLVGGVALAAVTAARRTDSSYPDFLARTNPAGLLVQPQVNDYVPGFERQLARLAHVRSVTAAASRRVASGRPARRVASRRPAAPGAHRRRHVLAFC